MTLLQGDFLHEAGQQHWNNTKHKHMKTQKDIVKEKLLKEGKVDNKWAILEGGIWRLSSIINKLKNEGINTVHSFKEIKGKKTKISVYSLEN